MKNKIILAGSGIVAAAILLASCEKPRDKEVATETLNFTNTSQVQIYNAIAGSLRNYATVDANALNGATIGFGTTFPSTPTAFSLTSGFREFTIRDTATVTTQPQLTFAENFMAGNRYTIFLYDTAISPKQKTVQNNIVIPTDTTARLRFANFIYNPSVIGTGFDIFSTKRQAVIFSNVKETEVTDYIPYASALTDTFYIRLNGTSSNLQNVDTTGKPTIVTLQAVLNPTRLRSYTLIWRGSYRTAANKGTTGTALPAARGLSVFANY